MKSLSSLVLLFQHFASWLFIKLFQSETCHVLCGRRTLLRHACFLSACVVAGCCQQLIAEVPKITSLFPAGLQRGTTAELKLNGKPGTLPIQVWSDGDQLTDFQFSEKGDSLTLTASANARPGLHWIRFYNQEGACSLLPIFVGVLDERTEKEPNNSTIQAELIEALPLTINGVLHQSGEVDTFAVTLSKGKTLTASVSAHESLGSPMDSVLQVLDKDGFVIMQNDDDHGFDSLLQFKVPKDGSYFVRLFCFPATPNSTINFAGGAEYIYRLMLTESDFSLGPRPKVEEGADSLAIAPGLHAFEKRYSEFKEKHQSEDSEPLLLLDGKITQPNEAGVHTLSVKKGDALRIQVLARQIASFLDPVLIIRTPNGDVHKEIDDSNRDKRDIDYDWTAPGEGEYQFAIVDRYQHAGDRYFYLLAVVRNSPRVELSVPADHFELKRDTPLEIPISINRITGFKSAVKIQLKNPPAGLVVTEVVSEEKGDSAKKVTLKVDGSEAEPFQGVIQIAGTYEASDRELVATTPLKTMEHKTSQLWLTIPGKKPAKSESVDD